jgi:N-acyl-D-aspartate/D-glutamate deacylase
MTRIVIAGATIVDGAGSPAYTADVAVSGRQISEIGKLSTLGASEVIDANGLVLAPGFIDPHVHYDAQVMWDPALTPSSLNGVTTVVGGNCGFGVAPLGERNADYILRMLANVEGMSIEALEAGSDWSWDSFDEWLGRLAGHLTVNAAFFIGHSTVRRYVMGADATARPASDEEVAAMTELVGAALGRGAVGLSTSLNENHHDGDGVGVPSRHADRRELLALAASMHRYPGRMLEIVPPMAKTFDRSIYELLSSLSLASNGTVLWNSLAIDAAHPEWHDPMLEASSYAAGCGADVVALTIPDVSRLRLSFSNGMILQAFDGWAELFAMPHGRRRSALRDPRWRARLRGGLTASMNAGLYARFVDFAPMHIGEATSPGNAVLNGLTVADAAQQRGTTVFDTALDLAVAEDLDVGFWPPPSGDDDRSWKMRSAVWQRPDVLVGGGDAGAHLDAIDSFNYPAVLAGPIVRDRGLLALEDAVRLMTSVPAERFGLSGRGRLAVGAAADLVLFDPTTFGPGDLELRADLPGGGRRLYSEARGLHQVYVNGTLVVRDGELTGAVPGQVLRARESV